MEVMEGHGNLGDGYGVVGPGRVEMTRTPEVYFARRLGFVKGAGSEFRGGLGVLA